MRNKNKYQKVSDVLNQEVKYIFNQDLKDLLKGKVQFKKGPKKQNGLKLKQQHLLGLVIVFFVFGSLFSVVCLTLAPGMTAYYLPSLKEFFQDKEQEWQDSQLNKFLNQPGFSSDYRAQTSQEEAVINVVKKASPSVVSIIISKDIPILEMYYETPFEEFFSPSPGFPFEIEIEIPQYRQKGTEKRKVGGGTGFIVSEDGLIVTNKHVVSDDEAEYTVVTSAGKVYSALVAAIDPLQDLAIIKIEAEQSVDGSGGVVKEKFPVLKLGKSSQIQIGQSVVAIGNALGEFRNTVSVGVISGLARSITATTEGLTETLEDVIQTDAAINTGNSGGPLLNLRGEVIGVNVAKAESAQSIGFSIPIDKVRQSIESAKKYGKISYPFLGIRYVMINPEVKEEQGLTVDYGALIVGGDEPGIVDGSAADKAGLQEDDIILEVDGKKINQDNRLSDLIKEYQPNQTIVLFILRGKQELTKQATLGEISSED